MSHDLDLSGLFEEQVSPLQVAEVSVSKIPHKLWIPKESGLHLQDEAKEKVMLVSDHTVDDTMTRIQAAAADVDLSIERSNNKVCETLQDNQNLLSPSVILHFPTSFCANCRWRCTHLRKWPGVLDRTSAYWQR